MYRQVYIVVAIYLIKIYAADDFQTCLKIADLVQASKNLTCCLEEPIDNDKLDQEMVDQKTDYEKYKECKDLPNDPDDCSKKERCIAEKSGSIDEKGEVNKTAILSLMEAELKDIIHDDIYNKFKIECIDGDLSKYTTVNSCPWKELEICFEIQYIIGCVKWSDKDSCKEMRDIASECAKMFP